MALREQRLGEMDVQLLTSVGEANTVPAHLVNEVLPEENHVLCAVLHPRRVATHVRVRKPLRDRFYDGGGERWAWQDGARSRVLGARYEEELGIGAEGGEGGEDIC